MLPFLFVPTVCVFSCVQHLTGTCVMRNDAQNYPVVSFLIFKKVADVSKSCYVCLLTIQSFEFLNLGFVFSFFFAVESLVF